MAAAVPPGAAGVGPWASEAAAAWAAPAAAGVAGAGPTPAAGTAAPPAPGWKSADETNARCNRPACAGSVKNPGDSIAHGVPISFGRTLGSSAAISVIRSRAATFAGPTG